VRTYTVLETVRLRVMMTSTGYTTNMDEGRQRCLDDVADQTTCASGTAQPQPRHSVPAVTATVGRPSFIAPAGLAEIPDAGSAGESRDAESPRCERHGDRVAELYCHTCEVPICTPCASTRHLPTSGHRCWDIADAVDHCRSRLGERVRELEERYTTCLRRVEDTSTMIDSIRSKHLRVYLFIRNAQYTSPTPTRLNCRVESCRQ